MDTVNKAMGYAFALALILIALVYFVGLRTDIGSLKDALNTLWLTGTGRNSAGNFAAYPKGG